MGNFDTTKVVIKNAIKENNNHEITGSILQNVLINMLNSIGVGYIFGGIATPTTEPETGTNAPVYYIANEVGTYVNFDNIVVNKNEFAFLINGDDKKWKKTFVNVPTAATVKALEDKIPIVQSSSSGNTKNYIYSTGTDADKDCVASCNWWTYSERGNIYVRWKRWGADDNTHYDHDNEEHQTSQYLLPYMGIDGGRCYQDGLLPWKWGQRMKDAGEKYSFIREEQSTAEQVNLRYLNFANGNVYDTPISKATTAKAGVMTAEDKTKLDNLTAYARDLGNFESEEAALDALKNIEISSNSNIVHAHCTYANGAMSITMMQSIENDCCRQVIFNKSKVFQRAIYFTDGTRQEISHAEDWSCLFGDRLQWDSGENKYVLRQFDLSFNKEHTDPIPIATDLNDGLMSKEDKKKLKVAIVTYNVYSLIEQEVGVDAYPSTTEDFKSGQELRIFKTKGKNLPSGINPEKYGIWFGAYLGPTAGYKRYNTESVCGITSEELFKITSNVVSENYYVFVDSNNNYAVLQKQTPGLLMSSENPNINALFSMKDIKKLLIK